VRRRGRVADFERQQSHFVLDSLLNGQPTLHPQQEDLVHKKTVPLLLMFFFETYGEKKPRGAR